MFPLTMQFEVLWMISVEAGFSILSPLAGLIADVAYGKLRVLKFSTYLIVACTFGVLVMLILLNATEVLVFRLVSIIFFFGSYLSHVFFQANIILFGTDQHRDMPTEKSVQCIHMYVWSQGVTYLFTNTVLSTSHILSWRHIQFHASTLILLEAFCISVLEFISCHSSTHEGNCVWNVLLS